eukprot:m.351870 g.351870  ORF g.351870 m.351870 type:complete len:464 (-) comp16386_c1_seq1:171-1562(-)
MALRSMVRPASRLLTTARLGASVRLASSSSQGEFNETALSNGFRVVSLKTHHQTASVAVHVDAGSRFETPEINGTAHFLEHMAFKGTANRSQQQLENEVEQKGIRLDAYTSRESTVFAGRCFAKDTGATVDILGDILTNPLLSEDAIEVERRVIQREYKEVNAIPYEVAMDYLHTAAYQNSPLGLTILGSPDNIQSITRNDLSNYINTFYTAPRMTLVATGGVDHEQLVAAAEKAFGGLSAEDKAPAVPACEFYGFQVTERDDFAPVATIAMAFEGAPLSSEDYYPLAVASAAVGSWQRGAGGAHTSASPLARAVADESLAQSYQSFVTPYSDTALWGVVFEAAYDQVDDASYAITNEWGRLALYSTDNEIQRAKAQLKAATLFALDSNFALNDHVGRQYAAFGRYVSPAEIVASIDAVSPSQVRKAMQEYIYDKDPAVAAVGPIEQLPDYARMRYDMSWVRS